MQVIIFFSENEVLKLNLKIEIHEPPNSSWKVLECNTAQYNKMRFEFQLLVPLNNFEGKQNIMFTFVKYQLIIPLQKYKTKVSKNI